MGIFLVYIFSTVKFSLCWVGYQRGRSRTELGAHNKAMKIGGRMPEDKEMC
jgi:hypothetical protein